jgi:hypothetical protein
MRFFSNTTKSIYSGPSITVVLTFVRIDVLYHFVYRENTHTQMPASEGMFLLLIKLDPVTSQIAPYNGVVMEMRQLLVTSTEFYNLFIRDSK